MKLNEFIETVSGLVREWNVDPPAATDKLSALYAEVRNSTAFELAEAQRQRDEALRQLHRKITE